MCKNLIVYIISTSKLFFLFLKLVLSASKQPKIRYCRFKAQLSLVTPGVHTYISLYLLEVQHKLVFMSTLVVTKHLRTQTAKFIKLLASYLAPKLKTHVEYIPQTT